MVRDSSEYLAEAGGAPAPAARVTRLEVPPAEGDRCRHDLYAPSCATCSRNPDAADPDFMSEFGGMEQGFDYYGELGMLGRGWK
jgi:hypothetical protein